MDNTKTSTYTHRGGWVKILFFLPLLFGVAGLAYNPLSAPLVHAALVNEILLSGTSWTVPPGVTSVKVWAIGAGGGGGGGNNAGWQSSAAGGAGAVAYKTFSVTPGQAITYSLGAAGPGGVGAENGTDGGATSATYSGTTIIGGGGGGGETCPGPADGGAGGTPSGGGDGGEAGGNGGGASCGDTGAAGGGAIGDVDGGGASGSVGVDGAQSLGTGLSGLQTAVENAGETWTGVGAGGSSSSGCIGACDGGNAAGFGSGGGGSGWYGGNGGAGRYGGGGGGSKGGGGGTLTGGAGGQGVVVLEYSEDPPIGRIIRLQGYIRTQGYVKFN